MDLYRAMFYCNAESDRDANFIKAESLRIELIAGGLNWKQQDYIMERLQPNAFFEVTREDLTYGRVFLYEMMFKKVEGENLNHPVGVLAHHHLLLVEMPKTA